jgi:hypothetical protein
MLPYPDNIKTSVWNLLTYSVQSRRSLRIPLDDDAIDVTKKSKIYEGEAESAYLVRLLARKTELLLSRQSCTDEEQPESTPKALPRRITFPYSRHSSLEEVRHLVESFQPRDVWPCTFDVTEWARAGR